MDKKSTDAEPLSGEIPRQKNRSSLFVLMGFFAAFYLTTFFHIRPQFEPDHVDQDIDTVKPWGWGSIKPDRDLRWEKCYDEFECARLDVPMDWLDPTDDERVLIGVIKLAAKSKDKRFAPVFVNPGGPGGSGVSFLQKAGHLLQTIVGDNHDIISFDPRGVGVSTPRVECWGSSQKRKIWSLQDTHVVDERPGLIYDAYARSNAYSGVCEAAMNETGILHHLSTPSLARDMLEILIKTGHKKLRYWGFSYGTVLGGVFAGLYPERVERLVSDGNCDYHDWFKLDHANFLSDTDAIFDAFDEACHKVGPGNCAFWAETPKAIQLRRGSLLDQLKASPILIPIQSQASWSGIPQVITYSHIQRLTQAIIYKPLALFPGLAHVFAALEHGDGEPYMKMLREIGGEDLQAGELCSLDDVPATMPLETGTEDDAFPAIMCSDGEPLTETPQEFEKYLQRITAISRWAGAANVLFRLVCVGKKVRPKWRISDDDFKGDTAHPILFIGNKADNVTPLQSAFNNSARFPSSVVLRQNSYGHCSLAAASTCTARHIRAYFQEGKLPQPGTQCDSDYDLFELPERGYEASTRDELRQAVMGLFRDVDIPRVRL